MRYTISEDYQHPELSAADQTMILLTMHRRENLGVPMQQVFRALAKIARRNQPSKWFFLCIKILKSEGLLWRYLGTRKCHAD